MSSVIREEKGIQKAMKESLIYFDNAATTRKKPECVYDSFNYYIREIGTSPGRGSYGLGIEASRMLYQSRKTVAKYFGASEASNVAFTKNSTEAINLFVRGFLNQGDHVVISCFEHNAVLRPLHRMKELGIIDYTVIPQDDIEDQTKLISYLRPNTKLAIITLASNLTGQIVFYPEFAKVIKERGIKILLDSSQGAGKLPIDMDKDCVDAIAFTGHKDLYALPGVGGLVFRDSNIKLEPLIQGGTGIYGDNYTNPDIYPEAYESGTLNMPAIWSLKTSLDYLFENKETIVNKENHLMHYLLDSLLQIPRVITYSIDKPRVSTICFNIQDIPSNKVVEELGRNGICVRGGIHCAILAHETLGTVNSGAVRVSLNYMNTIEEIDRFCSIVREM